MGVLALHVDDMCLGGNHEFNERIVYLKSCARLNAGIRKKVASLVEGSNRKETETLSVLKVSTLPSSKELTLMQNENETEMLKRQTKKNNK